MEKLHYQGDWDYAGTRLRDTVVRYGGEPVYVYSVDEDGMAEIQTMSKSNEPHKRVPMEDLDLSPVPLGYSNTTRGCSFTSRMPTRHYKQGLNGVNMQCRPSGVNHTSRSLYKTIMGIYPTVRDCFEALTTDEVDSISFSRNFALFQGLNGVMGLYFRNKKVGRFLWNHSAQQANYTLDNRYQYLQEMLEEELHV